MKEKKTIAFGDIHGNNFAAQEAVRIAEKENAKAIFLGDYIDRGPSSMITLLILMIARDNHQDWVFLRGNHEEMILPFLKEPFNEDNIHRVFDHETYESFYELNQHHQENIIRFLQSTSYYYETDSYIFTHAPLKDYGYELPHISENEFLWNYDTTPYWKGKPFIHGHKAVLEPEFSYKGLNINTSCGMGGKLTGLIVPVQPSNSFQAYSIDETGKSVKFELYNQHLIKNN